jgi:hypothetical protein
VNINQLTSSVDQRLIFNWEEYASAKQRELYAPFDMGEDWMCDYKCGARLYEVDVNCVATVEQRERERNGGMVAPVQVPMSPELNCGVFTAYLLDPLL